MQFYKHLYLQQNIRRQKRRIIRRLNAGKFEPPIHLIVLSKEEGGSLEIINTVFLMQKNYPKDDLFVVGIAVEQEDALVLVEQIVKEVYNETGGTDVRSYILDRERKER